MPIRNKSKIKICIMKFCVDTCYKMSQKTKDQLANTAQNFFHLLEQFSKLKKTKCMNILIFENTI